MENEHQTSRRPNATRSSTGVTLSALASQALKDAGWYGTEVEDHQDARARRQPDGAEARQLSRLDRIRDIGHTGLPDGEGFTTSLIEMMDGHRAGFQILTDEWEERSEYWTKEQSRAASAFLSGGGEDVGSLLRYLSATERAGMYYTLRRRAYKLLNGPVFIQAFREIRTAWETYVRAVAAADVQAEADRKKLADREERLRDIGEEVGATLQSLWTPKGGEAQMRISTLRKAYLLATGETWEPDPFEPVTPDPSAPEPEATPEEIEQQAATETAAQAAGSYIRAKTNAEHRQRRTELLRKQESGQALTFGERGEVEILRLYAGRIEAVSAWPEEGSPEPRGRRVARLIELWDAQRAGRLLTEEGEAEINLLITDPYVFQAAKNHLRGQSGEGTEGTPLRRRTLLALAQGGCTIEALRSRLYGWPEPTRSGTFERLLAELVASGPVDRDDPEHVEEGCTADDVALYYLPDGLPTDEPEERPALAIRIVDAMRHGPQTLGELRTRLMGKPSVKRNGQLEDAVQALLEAGVIKPCPDEEQTYALAMPEGAEGWPLRNAILMVLTKARLTLSGTHIAANIYGIPSTEEEADVLRTLEAMAKAGVIEQDSRTAITMFRSIG